MSRPKKILAIVAASLGGLILLLIIATLVIVQTSWFSNFVREKIVASVEESTGGKVDLQSFQFDPWNLTATIRGFVLHGTEPANQAPLARIDLLKIHLKLFSGIYHAVDVAYIGIDHPQINFMVFPDGTTNVPKPKTPSTSSNSNGLQTVVDLKIGEFQIQNGWIQYQQQSSQFAAQGENLHALLNYSAAHPSYSGALTIDPLILKQDSRPPIDVHVNLPVTIEGNGLSLNAATLTTAASKVAVSASVQNLNNPVINADLDANLSLPEWQSSLGLPLDTNARDVPKTLTAKLSAHMDQKSGVAELNNANITLGDTVLRASGTLRNPSDPSASAKFNGNVALGQLSRLLKVGTAQIAGALELNGTAALDGNDNYKVDGTLASRGISIRQDGTRINDLALNTPFHADPYLISLDGLRLHVVGGDLWAKVFVEKMQDVSAEGTLHNFSLPGVVAAVTGKHLGYDGTLGGSFQAKGDLKAKGTSSYTANANLAIAPGTHGIPVTGRLTPQYSGASGVVALGNSYLAFPHSRLDLSGTLDRQININLVSHDLNDFLPAANFGSAKPETSLPITLRPGGVASVNATIVGSLSDPRITGHVAMSRFAAEQRPFDLLAIDLNATPSGANVQNGQLTSSALRANFDASIGLHKWSPLPNSPLSANLTIRNASVQDLLSLAGESSIPATGALTADVHVHGTYGDPTGSAVLQLVNGSAYNEPFSNLLARVNLADQSVTVAPLQLVTDAGTISVNAVYKHPRDSFMTGTANVQVRSDALQLAKLKAADKQMPGLGLGGVLKISADAAAQVREVHGKSSVDIQNVDADINAQGLRVHNQAAGDLSLTAQTANRTVNYKLVSDLAGSNVNVAGSTSLDPGYRTQADASIRNLSIQKVLSLAGESTLPVSGTLTADAHVNGTLDAPAGNASVDLRNATVYQEPIDRLSATVNYAGTDVNIPSLDLRTPAGSVTLTADFKHPEGNFNSGAARLDIKTSDINLAKIEHLHASQPTLAGTVKLAADVSAQLREQNGSRSVMVSSVNADASTAGLMLNHRDLGRASLNATTTGDSVNYRFASDIAKTNIAAHGSTRLVAGYPTNAQLTFSDIHYANIAPYISTDPAPPAFDTDVTGMATVSGPITDVKALNAHLEMSKLDVRTVPTSSVTGLPSGRQVQIGNSGPILINLNHGVLNVQQFHLAGPGTKVDVGGTVNAATEDMNVTADANLDLSVLQDINRNFYSSGAVDLTAAVRGTFAQPLINGRVDLKNANVNYATLPNGISNANGTILLTGNGAVIRNLTAQSGGGNITVTGFAGLTGRAVTFDVKTALKNVRVRYSGISVSSSASVTLTGNTTRSLISGNVTVNRIAYNSASDAGSMLQSFTSTPPSTQSAPSALLAGMHLDIHILTAPDLRVVTTYANRLSILANLNVRGTAANPGMVGRVSITDGQLVFFGNTYTVNTGNINFYDPNSIQPVINVSLQTLAQGVSVTLSVSGPMNNLQLSYTSDPPLTFEQIVELLATNTTPADPNIAANQPVVPQQSFTQMGESAVLGQAVANPLASRLKRVFGLSEFKIDPSVAGQNGTPTARVTLQQKIANNITFTYITDLTQSNSEIIRVQWDLTPNFSAVGMRDYNAEVSVQMFYKFKKR